MGKPQVLAILSRHRPIRHLLQNASIDWHLSHLVGRLAFDFPTFVNIMLNRREGNPCNSHLVRSSVNRCIGHCILTHFAQLDLSKEVKKGCTEEGLVGLTFNTIGVRY